MKKILLFVSLSLVLIIGSAYCLLQTTPVEYPEFENISSVDDILNPYLAHAQTRSAAIAFIQNGQVEYRNFGSLSADNEEAPTEQSLFEIGSISKVFTATVLAQMMEEGKVKANDPISKFLPDTIVNWGPELAITLEELSSHHSGMPRLPDNIFSLKMDQGNPYAHYTSDMLYQFLKGYTPEAKENRKGEYSNLGVGLLGHILALVNETDYETMLRQRIFQPMEMPNSCIELDAAAKAKLAPGHNGGKIVPNWDLPALAGAGAIRSDLTDMVKFMQYHLADNSIASETQRKRAVFNGNSDIGLGWITTRGAKSGKTITWHNGGTGGYRSFCGMIKEEQIAIVVLTNSTISADELGFLNLRFMSTK